MELLIMIYSILFYYSSTIDANKSSKAQTFHNSFHYFYRIYMNYCK